MINTINVKGKMVGYVQNNIFRKKVKGSKHFLRKPPAIAFDKSAIQIASQYKADRIRVLDKETGIVYHTTMYYFEKNNFEINRGHGTQQAMVLNQWRTYQYIKKEK